MKRLIIALLMASVAHAAPAEVKSKAAKPAATTEKKSIEKKSAETKPAEASVPGTELKQAAPNGHIEFEAVGRPSMIKIKGKSDALESNFKVVKNILSGEAKVKVESFTTGIDMRDEHMKNKYLEVGKFPESVLKIQDLKLPDNWSTKTPALKEFPFKGQLQLHGVEKEVSGTLLVEEKDLKTLAKFEINIKDFGIEIPAYLGIKVTEIVKVQVTLDKISVQEAK